MNYGQKYDVSAAHRHSFTAMIYDAVHNFHQPESGYRFSADSLLLAEFASCGNANRLADLGAGCGIVGLAALEKGRAPSAEEVFFVEVNPDFLEPLSANISLYQPRTAARLRCLQSDWRELKPEDFGGRLDYIMVNPPYFRRNSGRPSRNLAANAARHEVHGDLGDLCRCLARLLAPNGRAALMLPIRREAELLATLEACNLEPLRTRRPEKRLVLVEAVPK
ncbi:hypothetical protein C4J81_17465 [Deltaproteobacteria bacterium Smac51]|nr:hypothetical protein C4J81_17465 [Deltaproteobacteria bacterium Smac51]